NVASRPPQCLSRPELLEVRRAVTLALVVGDHHVPALARPDPCLGDDPEAALPLDVDFLVLAFRDHPVGQFLVPQLSAPTPPATTRVVAAGFGRNSPTAWRFGGAHRDRRGTCAHNERAAARPLFRHSS